LMVGILPSTSVAAKCSGEEGQNPPWELVYSDGSANEYHFRQDAKDTPINFEYTPVQPENSSSGVYSGGDAKQGPVDEKTKRELHAWFQKFETDKSLRADARAMGTGAFTVKGGECSRDFIVKDGSLLRQFNHYLEKLREKIPLKKESAH